MMKTNDYSDFLLYCREIAQYPILTPEQEYDLVKQYQQGDETAGQQIIQSSLRFVVKVSRKYFYTGHNYLEIIQEGNIGLIKALDHYDPERGVPFNFYAVWWIKATIRVFLEKSGKFHTGDLGHAKDLLPLDENIGIDDKYQWVDFLTDGVNPEKHYHDKERSHHISSLFEHGFTFLSKREAYVIAQRFFADPPNTLKELGLQMGLSRERIRQLQVRSMEKLKRVLEDHAGSFMQHEAFDVDNMNHGAYSEVTMSLNRF